MLSASPSNCSLRCRQRADFPFGRRVPFFGTNPFTKVLAGLASLPFFPARFTLPTARNCPFGHRRQSLYTGMTPHPAYFFPCPKREDAGP